jgi:hypothetical protein
MELALSWATLAAVLANFHPSGPFDVKPIIKPLVLVYGQSPHRIKRRQGRRLALQGFW